MKIIIAPAKRMKVDEYEPETWQKPCFLESSRQLLDHLKKLDAPQLMRLLHCSADIAAQAFSDYQRLDLNQSGTPALFSYDGIQYWTMAPQVMTDECLAYVNRNVRILSGFYGLLRPDDGVHPHRLEMDSPLKTTFCGSLFEFWGDRLYRELIRDDDVILDLASAQHARSVRKYVQPPVRCIKCLFYEREGQRLKEKGVYVKIARGEMVRYLAEIQADRPEAAKTFTRRHYRYHEELSDSSHYIFIREGVCPQ